MSLDRSLVRHQMRFVNAKLNDWDFIGVGDSVSDEYECMVGPLTRMLRDGEPTDEIAAYINGEIDDHFGLGGSVSGNEVNSLVADLVETWLLRSKAGFAQSH
ncbi:MAG: hypothetical protein H7288_20740 [Kineosporiaceae bacterium]|nr:hypothetical protein [Aeromicrobium sp.]